MRKVLVNVHTVADSMRPCQPAKLTYWADRDVCFGDEVLVDVTGRKYIGTVVEGDSYYHIPDDRIKHVLEVRESSSPALVVV